MARYTSVPTPGFATDLKRLRKKFRGLDRDLGRFRIGHPDGLRVQQL
jgi:hypothetical protein